MDLLPARPCFRASRRGLVATLATLLLPGAALLRAAKSMTELRIIVQDGKGRPVPRASVILRPLQGKKLKTRKKLALELKTSEEGSTPVPPLPQGHVLIQVIATGFRTHGEQYALKDPEQTKTIVLEKPSDQVSVHKE